MDNDVWKSRVRYQNGTFGVLPSNEFGYIEHSDLLRGATEAEAASASAASASASSPVNRSLPLLKPTAASGDRGGGVFPRDGAHWISHVDEETNAYIVQPADSTGNVVSMNDPSHIITESVVNDSTYVANLSSATPVSRRNVTARAAASAAAEEEEESDQVVASTLFSPAVARPSALSLTPHDCPPRNRNSQNSQNSPRKNTSANRNRKGGSRKKRTYRKKRTQRKKTRRSRY